MTNSAKRLDGLLSQKRAMNDLLRERRKSDESIEPAPLRVKAPPTEDEEGPAIEPRAASSGS